MPFWWTCVRRMRLKFCKICAKKSRWWPQCAYSIWHVANWLVSVIQCLNNWHFCSKTAVTGLRSIDQSKTCLSRLISNVKNLKLLLLYLLYGKIQGEQVQEQRKEASRWWVWLQQVQGAQRVWGPCTQIRRSSSSPHYPTYNARRR